MKSEVDTILDRIEERHALMARLEAEQAADMVELQELVGEQYGGAMSDSVITHVALEVGLVTKASQNYVTNRLLAYRFVWKHMPKVWAAFQAGAIDSWRVCVIAESAARLRRDESVATIDEAVAGYAPGRTIARLKAWLRRWLMKLEPAEAEERADAERADRFAYVRHGDSGMSVLVVKGPTPQLQIIDKQLNLDAKLNQGDKTLAQARADVVIDLLTGGKSVERSNSHFHIGITMPLESLLGISDEPAVASDESFVLSPGQVRRLLNSGDALVSRILTDKRGYALDVTELGRIHSPKLKRSLQLVDGICSFPTCERPAILADIDHADEHQHGGPTSGRNAHPCCRLHHVLKTMGVLRVVIRDGDLYWSSPSGREYKAVTHMPRELDDFAAA